MKSKTDIKTTNLSSRKSPGALIRVLVPLFIYSLADILTKENFSFQMNLSTDVLLISTKHKN